jgi:endo-1,4-beta-xylanase
VNFIKVNRFLILIFLLSQCNDTDSIKKYEAVKFEIEISEVNINSIHDLKIKPVHRVVFGSAIVARELSELVRNNRYRTIVSDYNQVVFENDLKWRQWEESKTNNHGTYRMDWTTEALQWLNKNEITVSGHYLAWAPIDRNPFYQQHKDNPEVFRKLLFDHIEGKLNATKEYILEWDAINHIVAYHESGTRLDHIYGKEIYLDILNFAHKIHPEARLYVNESGILANRWNSETIRDEYYEIIRYLMENDAPLHGIGFMNHFNGTSESTTEQITAILDRFSEFGLPLKITEFDYQLGERGKRYSASAKGLQRQADFTEQFLYTVASHHSVEGIIFWGFWEGRHWYPGAALYDKDWYIRPNGEVWNRFVEDYLWLEKMLNTDDSVQISFTALPGSYQLVITAENSSADTVFFNIDKNAGEYFLKKEQNQWIITAN